MVLLIPQRDFTGITGYYRIRGGKKQAAGINPGKSPSGFLRRNPDFWGKYHGQGKVGRTKSAPQAGDGEQVLSTACDTCCEDLFQRSVGMNL